MKTSINFKEAKPDSEIHNFRKKTFEYIHKELTVNNEYWQQEKISDRIQKIEAYCKEKSGRKLQRNAMPVREAVVVIKEDTTMKDLHDLSRRLEQELGIRVFQIAIHKDEGHLDKESSEWKPNYHAHLVADWQDLKTGKTLKHQSFHYSKMQDLAAESLGMERGTSGSVGRLEAVEFKIQKKEEELKALEIKIQEMTAQLGSGKFNDLIIKETNFLGIEQINLDKTTRNYGDAFRLYNAELLKASKELEAKNKNMSELKKETGNLKKEIADLKSRNTILLTDPYIFAIEKKKYQESVLDALQKSIRHERIKNPDAQRMDDKNLLAEMNKICNELSVSNHIPISAFEHIFKAVELAAGLFSLLRFGDASDVEPEIIHVPKKKKKRIIRH